MGNLLQAWGGPSDPNFLETKCRQRDGCFWPGTEHGIYVDHNDFVYLTGVGRARDFYGQFASASRLRKRFPNPEVQDGRHVRAANRQRWRDRAEQQRYERWHQWDSGTLLGSRHDGGSEDEPYVCRGRLRETAGVLIVDAATGKYVGHFGAYGQNPVVGENAGTGRAGEGTGTWPDEFKRGEMKPKFFRSPVHCARLANDGLLYVCDQRQQSHSGIQGI